MVYGPWYMYIYLFTFELFMTLTSMHARIDQGAYTAFPCVKYLRHLPTPAASH